MGLNELLRQVFLGYIIRYIELESNDESLYSKNATYN